MKIAGLFPGQGSQATGMGKAFYDGSEEAKEIFYAADKALGFSLSQLCFNGPIEELTLTKNAQPAILLVSTVAFRLAGLQLDCAAGHSLGEYSALVAAGALNFEDAIQLVHKRGSYMQEAVQPGAGKMLAVMGPTPEEIAEVTAMVTAGTVEAANFNSPGQTVVAGDVAGVDAFAELMTARGAKVIPLNVSAPFHCRLMDPAKLKLEADLASITINAPRFPVYSNVTAKAHTTTDEIRNLLAAQVTASVQWTNSMVNMIEGEGVTNAVEFGAGGVLSKLLKRINKDVKRCEVDSPEALPVKL